MPHLPRPHPTLDRRGPLHHVPVGPRAALCAVAVACVLALAGCAAVGPGNGPAAVVQRFITASALQSNGSMACTYLTFAERRAASAHGEDEGCRQTMNAGGLILGGDAITSVHALRALTVRTKTDGDRAWVQLSHDGSSASFELVRADAGELDEFEAPNSDWRIARGALALVDHPASSATARGPAA